MNSSCKTNHVSNAVPLNFNAKPAQHGTNAPPATLMKCIHNRGNAYPAVHSIIYALNVHPIKNVSTVSTTIILLIPKKEYVRSVTKNYHLVSAAILKPSAQPVTLSTTTLKQGHVSSAPASTPSVSPAQAKTAALLARAIPTT